MKRNPAFPFFIVFVINITFLSDVSSDNDAELFAYEGIEKWHSPRIKRQFLLGIEIKECTRKEFRCDLGSCIKYSLICNGVKDCANGNDETTDLCSHRKCKDGQFRCKYGGCVDQKVICDGDYQCLDRSDEDEQMCLNFTCPAHTFRCAQGSCLDKGRLCDGWCTCANCGEETKELCEHNVCPKNKFRCDYGGCLDDDLLCDGFSHCKDGADENVDLCGNRTCPEDRFRCSNGLCIQSYDVCDGHCHCPKCQDETAEQCENNKCSNDGRSFRCDYGGCIRTSQVCDGVKNCADNSDESSDTCRRNNPKDQSTCTVPAITADREFVLRCPSIFCENRAGKRVEQYARVLTRCTDGYNKEDGRETISTCIDGQWKPSIPRCKKTCKKLTRVNEELNCFRSRHGIPVSCDSPLTPGSVAFIKCKEAYRPPGNKRSSLSLTCNENGEWSDKLYRCEPECGKSLASGQNLIIHGTPEAVGESPWHVAIYSTATSKNPELICGATIISEVLIVSAAHCFRDSYGNPYSEEKFEAVVGKLDRNYNSEYSKAIKRYKIKKIYYPSHEILNRGNEKYRGDIALLQTTEKIAFNKLVVPACVDWAASGPFVPTQTSSGKLAGWGHDTSGKPSNILLAAFMPYISKAKCLESVNIEFSHSITGDKFCAGSLAGAGARPGDSGGGLLFRDVYYNSYYIRGIVSSKDDSNTSLATFTDIGLYMDWIETVLNEIKNDQ